jgi:hypothetical protein
MTFPCVDETQFTVVDGTHLQPKDHMQWRHVATNVLNSNSYSFTVVGAAPNQDLAELQVAWTNTSPISQNVYCLITRGGTTVVTQARSVAYIETYWAATQGAAPADPNPTPGTLIGRYGNGSDCGVYPSSSTNALYLITETRTPDRTYPIGSTVVLPATHTYKLRIRLRWQAQVWESVGIDGGNTSETESSLVTGATRLDLFSTPVL